MMRIRQKRSRVLSDDNSDGTDGDTSFWERPDGVKKMTITDIFGPEARKILNR